MTESELQRLEAENDELRRRIAAASSAIDTATRPVPPNERDELAQVQARADSVAVGLGASAPSPRPGETVGDYRRRIVRDFKRHSPQWRDVDLDAVPTLIFERAERQIFADAQKVSASGEAMPGRLVARTETDAAGREIVRFHGDPLVFLAPFMGGGRRCRITKPGFE